MNGGDSVQDGPLKLSEDIKESDCSLLAHKNPNKLNNENTCLSQDILDELGGLEKIKKETGCDNDECILEKVTIKIDDETKQQELLRLKPEGPRNDNTWYSNFNIDEYFATIQAAYPNYKHINFATIDFASIDHELNNVSIVDLIKENKNCLGCVVNTDISTGRGKHWICVFLNADHSNKKCTVEFFNSSGNKPVLQMHEWMNKQKNICEKNNYECEIIIASSFRHQLSDTECGPYACYYISSRVSGVPYQYFKENRIKDEIVEDFRKYMFRN